MYPFHIAPLLTSLSIAFREQLRLLLFIFLNIIVINAVTAQFEFIPLTHNPYVKQAHEEAIRAETSMLGIRSNALVHRIFMPPNKQRILCLNTLFEGTLPLHEITNLECRPLTGSNVSVGDSCLTINSLNISSLQEDIICLELCDEEGICVEVNIIIETRPYLRLPFLEEFSHSGPFPDRSKWLDRFVFINRSMAKDPLSFGVATFDGLDETGSPYGGEEADVSDFLTSGFFDFSGLSINDNLFLSFYIQKKGLGLRPRLNDVFRLEFRNAQGNWVLISEYPGISGSFPSADSPPFEYYAIRLTDAYMHDAFQFRFSNVGSRSGIREVWHLDYVRLERNRTASAVFEDVAFTRPPASILFPYTAMPLNHFISHEDKYLNTDVPIGLYNHSNERRLADPSWHLIREEVGGTNILTEGNLTLLELQPVVPQNQRDLNPGRHDFINPLRSSAWINNWRASVAGLDSARFTVTYTLNQDQENINNIAETIRNNRVSSSTILRDYFAYDDGTAEMGIALISNPTVLTQMAIKYHAETADSIQGFQIHFPYVEGDQSNTLFNFKIWIGELKDDEEDYRLIFQRPIYPDQFFDTLQAFTTYALISEITGEETKVHIPPGDFYIGVQQVTIGSRIPMGFDRNNPQGLDYIYFNRGFGWEKFSDQGSALPGAVMFRPIMGGDPLPLITEVNEVIPVAPSIKIWPNPNSGTLYLGGSDLAMAERGSIEIVSALGQIVGQFAFNPEIHLHNLSSGVYFVLLRNESGQIISRQKLMVRK